MKKKMGVLEYEKVGRDGNNEKQKQKKKQLLAKECFFSTD